MYFVLFFGGNELTGSLLVFMYSEKTIIVSTHISRHLCNIFGHSFWLICRLQSTPTRSQIMQKFTFGHQKAEEGWFMAVHHAAWYRSIFVYPVENCPFNISFIFGYSPECLWKYKTISSWYGWLTGPQLVSRPGSDRSLRQTSDSNPRACWAW